MKQYIFPSLYIANILMVLLCVYICIIVPGHQQLASLVKRCIQARISGQKTLILWASPPPPPPINLDAQFFSVKEILDWAIPPPPFGEKFSVFSDKILLDWVRPPPLFGQSIQKSQFFMKKLLSSPRAESARAVTGRRCPHSGVGEDFLGHRSGRLTKTGVTRERKVVD